MANKREYKESEYWDDMVDTTTFQFEQLCNFMWWYGYPTYNKNFTFVSFNKNSPNRYMTLDRAVAMFNKCPSRLRMIEKVRLEKRKSKIGGYYLESFGKVKFFKHTEHLADVVLSKGGG